MNQEDIKRKQEILDALKWRLHERELQAAMFGASADPIVKIEIDDLKEKIEIISQEILAGPKTHKFLHNLPQPDYVRFIGRKNELLRLRELLHHNSRTWVVVIDGVGGIGKSALALEIAHQYLSDNPAMHKNDQFQCLIWVSAKAASLTADGVTSRQPAIRTLDDIHKTIAITLEHDNILLARPEEQDRLIRRALTQQRTLLIIDNLETIDDERVNTFIRELPEPTKCIVTTRHRIDVAYPIRLTGLPTNDALDLISQECEKKDVSLTKEQANLLFKRTGGVPLAVVWSVAQMGYGYSAEAVLQRLGSPSADIAKYCFEGILDRIRNKQTKRLLIALCLAIKTSRSVLGYVANVPELDRDEGLVELERLSLVNKQRDSFEILPLVIEYMMPELRNLSKEDAEDMILRVIENNHSLDVIVKSLPFIDISIDTQDKAAKIIDNQLWGYIQGYDENTAYYYASELSKIKTPVTISSLKWLANEDISSYNPYTQYPYGLAEEAIRYLVMLEEIDYLLDLYQKSPLWPSENFILRTTEKYAQKSSVILKLDNFLSLCTDEKIKTNLIELKEKLKTFSY